MNHPALQATPQWEDADAFYEQLLDAHAGLSAEDSALLNARLILVLAHQIGRRDVLTACIEAARLPG
ncbi:DUF2783 domain-containing protein [Hydrogenophaga sp. IBVHS2]|uniref:DUF2783 domain-containing protein n=1 Tax=Hydrogenophaga sp. IBVHS2 TaxID=1985170 RepID=UPI000A2D2390|nr:DUF2783 domain-containing protein [Hydrogenophaga sp. IBVHS2]OSZ64637.1 hypothetical protein CAP38_09525 [Hydrogenophaga sp. IBVHS2]